MKNQGIAYIIIGVGVAVSFFLGTFVQKKITKQVVVHDTVYAESIKEIHDTIRFTKYLKPDTFYTQEIFTDTILAYQFVDTAAILDEFNKVNVYRDDTLVHNKITTVVLSEEVHQNKIRNRVIVYDQLNPIYTELPKTKYKLYLGAEMAATIGGLTETSLGVGLKNKKDWFFLVKNNFADGLKLNIGAGAYIPITK